MGRISNLNLIKELLKDGRKPYQKIADILKGVTTESAVRKRVKKLITEGAIRKFTIDVNPKKLGFQVQALIGIDVDGENYGSIIKKLKTFDEILTLSTSTGDHAIIMECWFKNSEELADFEKKLLRIAGVTRICPTIINEKIK